LGINTGYNSHKLYGRSVACAVNSLKYQNAHECRFVFYQLILYIASTSGIQSKYLVLTRRSRSRVYNSFTKLQIIRRSKSPMMLYVNRGMYSGWRWRGNGSICTWSLFTSTFFQLLLKLLF